MTVSFARTLSSFLPSFLPSFLSFKHRARALGVFLQPHLNSTQLNSSHVRSSSSLSSLRDTLPLHHRVRSRRPTLCVLSMDSKAKHTKPHHTKPHHTKPHHTNPRSAPAKSKRGLRGMVLKHDFQTTTTTTTKSRGQGSKDAIVRTEWRNRTLEQAYMHAMQCNVFIHTLNSYLYSHIELIYVFTY